ncbi:MFS transporter [Halioxenophilus aromaticivorans]|uniref:MFS transporter n=1 Tax=Halioxenophilus aromaticivorans TaxID=1306992 RepID=A0AAV3U3I8_9ALTE
MKISLSAWGTIFVASCVLLLAFGFRASFGLFVEPITTANQWGRDTLSLALAIQNLVWGLLAVFAGGLADRFGGVKVIIGGALLYAAGLWLTAGVNSVLMLQVGAGFLVGAGIAGTAFGIVLPLMAKAVTAEHRQWVMGVGTAAGSLGQFVMAPLAQQFIDWFGWVGALHAMSLMALSMIVLALLLAKLIAHQLQPVAQAGAEDDFWGVVHLARKIGSYWLLTLGFFVCGFHLAFITVHFPGYLSDKGFAPEVAAWSIAIIGLCNVFGALASGVISGRKSMRTMLLLIYAGRGVITAGLLLIPLSLTTVILFSALTGFLWLATVPPTTGLVAKMFGVRYLATLYGVVFLGHQVGSFCGVWLGGWLYEKTGSYDWIWWISIALSFVAVALHWPIKERSMLAARAC